MQNGISLVVSSKKTRQDHETLAKFRLLTEYECERALTAIEWVARAQKPIVEAGGYLVANCDVRSLAHDLDRCITMSGETVRGFIMPTKDSGYCSYGFYRYAWAIKALLAVWGTEPVIDPYGSLWLQGLVFGYSPASIQRLMSSSSDGRESKLHSAPCIRSGRHRKVEIYGILARLVQRRNTSTRIATV